MTDQVPAPLSDSAPPATAGPPIGATSLVPPVVLKGEIEIYPDTRLSQLDQGPIKAYAAKSKARERAVAYLCEKTLVPQIYASSMYYGLSNPALPRLIGAGVVDWTPLHQQRYVFVYEDKLGKPIATSSNIDALGLKNDLVLNTIIRNLVPAIKDMRDADFVHGNIRVNNLFDGGGATLDKVMLGECLTTPCGYLQPTVYETIERAAAHPLGRGPATYFDDMYAFGITLAVLLRDTDPMAGFSPEKIIAEKIEQGSYAAVTGKERFTGSLLEALRGLLNDDPRQRWTIDDIVTWAEGRRVHPKPGLNTRLKASRPLDFADGKYLRPQMLALALPEHPKETAKMVEGHDLGQWLNRSLQDKALEDRVEAAIEKAEAAGTSGFYPERLACYMALALAPGMPMMFRGLSFIPAAFGAMLVEACILKKDLNPYVEVINDQMLLYWLTTQDAGSSDGNELVMKFDTCRAFLRQPVIGYGIERCIYFLSSEVHCLSDRLKDVYARSAEDMLNAFEAIASKGDNPENFLDRHVVAFLSIRDRQVIDPYVPDLNADEKYRRVLATMRVLASIQKRSKLPALPGVSAWLVDGMEPLVSRFHDRDTRTRLRTQLQKMRDKGDLNKLSGLFDNPQIFQDDFNYFKSALKNYAGLRHEHARLTDDLENNKQFGFDTGRQVAAMVAAMFGAVIILIYIMIKVSGSGGFGY